MTGMEEKGKKHPAEHPSDQVTMTKTEHEELLQRLQEMESLKQRMLLAAADFENAKKRLTKERDEYVKFALEKLISNLVPVLDGFERAMTHTGEDAAQLKNVVTGIQRVCKQLQDVLKNEGLKRVGGKGQPFNPEHQEAIGYVEEKGRENEVVDEIEPAYFLNDRLIRAGKVRVRVSPKSHVDSPIEEKQDEIT